MTTPLSEQEANDLGLPTANGSAAPAALSNQEAADLGLPTPLSDVEAADLGLPMPEALAAPSYQFEPQPMEDLLPQIDAPYQVPERQSHEDIKVDDVRSPLSFIPSSGQAEAAALDFVQKKVAAPIFKSFQENIGKPLANLAIAGQEAEKSAITRGLVVGSELVNNGPAAAATAAQQMVDGFLAEEKSRAWFEKKPEQFLLRETLAAVGGESMKSYMVPGPQPNTWIVDDKKVLEGVKGVEDVFGTKKFNVPLIGAVDPASMAQSFAHELGYLPLYIAPPVSGNALVSGVASRSPALKALFERAATERVLGQGAKAALKKFGEKAVKGAVVGAGEGAVQGTVSALVDPTKDVGTSFLAGTVGGAGFGGALESAGAVVGEVGAKMADELYKGTKALIAYDKFGARDLEAEAIAAAWRAMRGEMREKMTAAREKLHVESLEAMPKLEGEIFSEQPLLGEFASKRADISLKEPLAVGGRAKKDEFGELVMEAVAVEMQVGKHGEPLIVYHTADLTTPKAMDKWVEQYGSKALNNLDMTADVDGTLREKFYEAVNRHLVKLEEIQAREQVIIDKWTPMRNPERKPLDPNDMDDALILARANLKKKALEESVEASKKAGNVDDSTKSGVASKRPDGVVQMQGSWTQPRTPAANGEHRAADLVTVHIDGEQLLGSVIGRNKKTGVYRVELVPSSVTVAKVKRNIIEVGGSSLTAGSTPQAIERATAAMKLLGDPLETAAVVARNLGRERAAFEWLKVVRPEDLYDLLGYSQREMAEAMGDAVGRGGEMVEGHFFPNKPQKDMHVDDSLPPEGTYVYFGSAGNSNRGIFRGVDPLKKDHYLIDIAPDDMTGVEMLQVARKGKQPAYGKLSKFETISLPKQAWNTMIPVHLGDKKLASIPPTWGLTLPIHPGEFIPPNSSEIEAAVTRLHDLEKMPPHIVERVLKSVRNFFEGSAHQGDPVLAGTRNKLYANSAEAQEREAAERALKKQLGQKYYSDSDRALEPLIELRSTLKAGETISPRDAALEKWAADHPQLAMEGQKLVDDMLRETKANQLEIAQLRGNRDNGPDIALLELERMDDLRGEYIRQSYHIFKQGEEWVKHLRDRQPEKWRAAIEYFRQQGGDVNSITHNLLEALHEIRATDGSVASIADKLRGKKLIDTQAFRSLQGKKDIPEPIRQLLGPEESGMLALASTWARTRAVKNQLKAWNEVSESAWWSRERRSDLTVFIPDEPIYGKAAGGWTSPEFAPLLEKGAVEKNASILVDALGFGSRMWKKNVLTYGGPGPWANNAVRNVKGMVLGGIDPMDFEGAFASMKEFLRTKKAYGENPTRFGEGGLYEEMVRFGVISPGMGQSELVQHTKRLNSEIMKALEGATDSASMWRLLRDAVDGVKRGDAELTAAYDFVDQFAKATTYLYRRKKNLAKGMSVHNAASEASLAIKRSFPDYSNVSKSVDFLRKRAGLFAPFLAAKTEDIRINAQVLNRLRTAAINGDGAERDLAARLAKFTLVLGAAYGTMKAMRWSNGITDEMIEKEKAKLSMRELGQKPFLVAGWDWDEKGRMPFINFTPYEDLLMSLRGNQVDPMVARLARNTMIDIVGEGTPMGVGIDSGLQGTLETSRDALMSRTRRPRSPRANELLQMMMDMAEAGAVPQGVQRVEGILNRGEESPMDMRDSYTPGEKAFRLFGGSLAVPGKGTQIEGARETRGRLKEFVDINRGAFKEATRRQTPGQTTKESVKDIVNTNVSRLKQYLEANKKKGK